MSSIDTNQLFQQYENLKSGNQSGGNSSVDTNQLFNRFLDETRSVTSVQSGGALSEEVISEEILQSGGNNKKPVSLKKAVSLLKEYYRNKYNN